MVLIFVFCLSAGAGILYLSLTTIGADTLAIPVPQEAAANSIPTEFTFFIPDGTRKGLSANGLCYSNGELFVSYRGSDRIDVYNSKLEPLRHFELLGGSPASISSIAVGPKLLFAADFKGNEILFADQLTGKLAQTFGFLPDGKTRVNPYSVTVQGEMLYVTDVAQHSVLVISTTDFTALRERGEVVLRIPPESDAHAPKFPTFTCVTPDGRLLISDLAGGKISVFSCSGRFITDFEVPGEKIAPMGLVQDDIVTSELQARKDTLFDPSGTLDQGRFHVADAAAGCIRVFDPHGRYLGSYGDTLIAPSGVAVDILNHRIFVADPGLGGIAIFTYSASASAQSSSLSRRIRR